MSFSDLPPMPEEDYKDKDIDISKTWPELLKLMESPDIRDLLNKAISKMFVSFLETSGIPLEKCKELRAKADTVFPEYEKFLDLYQGFVYILYYYWRGSKKSNKPGELPFDNEILAKANKIARNNLYQICLGLAGKNRGKKASIEKLFENWDALQPLEENKSNNPDNQLDEEEEVEDEEKNNKLNNGSDDDDYYDDDDTANV